MSTEARLEQGRVPQPGGERLRPQYGGDSILNLVASVSSACGGNHGSIWSPLGLLDSDQIRERRNIVLLVIDGCGAAFLQRYGRGSTLASNVLGSMTSVFPSTTASAITTFMTGMPPSRHALTGWHMYFAEVDEIIACLPLTPRVASKAAYDATALAQLLFGHRSLYEGLGRRSVVLAPQEIVGSAYNRYHARGALTCAYNSGSNLFDRLAALVGQDQGPRFIYAYYASFDALAHRYGIDSEEVRTCFTALDANLVRFLKAVAPGSTTLIVTADHGFIDSPPDRTIDLKDHPELAAMLRRPLCGERRAAYCYLKEGTAARFEAYMAQRLSHAAEAVPSTRLIADAWFGPGEVDPRLAQRVGDYTLLMKGNWTITDHLPGERRHAMIGVHGGTSAEEMLVPLVLIER